MIVSVSSEADRELIETARFYAQEGGVEIAQAFIDEFERLLGLLVEHPLIGASWGHDRRRLPMRKFPYSVVYYVRSDEARIVAIAHHRRTPQYWAGRR